MIYDYIRKTVRAAAILTNAYVAGTVLTDTRDFNQLVLHVAFTKGSLTTAEIKVEFSEDGTNYRQETFSAVTAGNDALSAGVHQVSASGTFEIKIPISTNNIKVSANGTGTVTSSSMAIDAILQRTT